MKTRVWFENEDLDDSGEWCEINTYGYVDGYFMKRSARLRNTDIDSLHAVVITDDGRILSVETSELTVINPLDEMQQITESEYKQDSNN